MYYRTCNNLVRISVLCDENFSAFLTGFNQKCKSKEHKVYDFKHYIILLSMLTQMRVHASYLIYCKNI